MPRLVVLLSSHVRLVCLRKLVSFDATRQLTLPRQNRVNTCLGSEYTSSIYHSLKKEIVTVVGYELLEIDYDNQPFNHTCRIHMQINKSESGNHHAFTIINKLLQ